MILCYYLIVPWFIGSSVGNDDDGKGVGIVKGGWFFKRFMSILYY